jgi:phosphomannomutase
MPVMAIDVASKAYICPGETRPISRSVHLARLAAAFPACRDCPLCEDNPRTVVRASSDIAPHPSPKRETIAAEGWRGVFHNEITRRSAAAAVTRFAESLWESSDVGGPNDGIDRGARQARPTVVVGYDERPSSPTVFAAATAAFRQMGCHVLDVGLVTKPCFRFAIHHLHAAGGVYVTGSGSEPACTGVDFFWQGARPASLAEVAKLRAASEIEGRLESSRAARPTRSAGSHRTFQAAPRYEAEIARHFVDVRSSKVACASSSPVVLQVVRRMFQPLSCELVSVDLPLKVRNPAQRRDEGILRLSTTVRERQAQVGILIDDDGQRCGFVDERGRHVSATAIARLVVPLLLGQDSGATVVLEPTAMAELRPLVEAMGGRCQASAGDSSAIAAATHDFRAIYAGGESGRHWFLEGFANCDALLIAARVLNAIGRTDQPFSQLAAS